MQKLSNYDGSCESPVCTKEKCTFRDSFEELKAYDAQVLGISVDGPFPNRIFTKNRHPNFPILSDKELWNCHTKSWSVIGLYCSKEIHICTRQRWKESFQMDIRQYSYRTEL
jgi:peroxiredoxin